MFLRKHRPTYLRDHSNWPVIKFFQNYTVYVNSDYFFQLVTVEPQPVKKLVTENKSYVNSISELRWIHSSLCDTVSLTNNTFGAVILTVTVTCLLHLIITPYFLIVQAGEKHEWIFLFVQVGWCIFHVTRMLMIVQPSYSTVAEGKKTAILVSQLLSSTFETDTRRELEIFSLQLLHRPIEFSACGLFPLDRTLITSVRLYFNRVTRKILQRILYGF